MGIIVLFEGRRPGSRANLLGQNSIYLLASCDKHTKNVSTKLNKYNATIICVWLCHEKNSNTCAVFAFALASFD